MSHDHAQPPVKLILFDAFDTLCTPRIPIHEQYHEEAIKAGLKTSGITPSSIRSAFKPAFREMESKWPLYGRLSTPPLSPEEWWTEVIKRTMVHAGKTTEGVGEVMPKLGPALLKRFESDEGYRTFPDTIPCLKRLREMGVKTSVVSNADPRILRTLGALSILPLLTYPPTLSWDIERSKPGPEIFQAACRACEVESGQGVIMVGDELKADYLGALSAGLEEARLIRRTGQWSDGAVRKADEDLHGIHVVQGLKQVVQEVISRNG